MTGAGAIDEASSHPYKTADPRSCEGAGMELVTAPRGPIDLTAQPIHLGLGSRASAVEGFGWDGGALAAYAAAAAPDGAEGRMVMVFQGSRSWDTWERHPAGDEVVVCLSGRMTIILDVDGEHEEVALGPCEAMVNPGGVWHTADVHEPVCFLTITPGQGTEHRPR
jgi:quercetin dioxygenase-like cupin family protein